MSPGPVKGAEPLCRGIYSNHIKNKAGDIEKSWLKKRDLVSAAASVWRQDHIGTLDQVVELLQARARTGATLERVVTLTADQIRSIQTPGRARTFCVLDDTNEGEKHHLAHATVGCCKSVPSEDLNGLDFMAVFDAIFLLYVDAEVWPAS